MSDTPSSLNTRPSLLVRIRDTRDTESWGQFVDVYGPLIYRYARSRGLQDADAADLVQDVLVEVGRSIPVFQYQPERGRFRDWLGTLTRRQLGLLLEKRARGGKVNGEAVRIALEQISAGQTDTEWITAFQARVLQAAMERIRPHFHVDTWRAFERTWLEHQPVADVAVQLGMQPDSVYVAKSRVLKRLTEEVLALAEDLPHFGQPE
jgi:RNA polymerase sigma-70 factor (ECF subfamily)